MRIGLFATGIDLKSAIELLPILGVNLWIAVGIVEGS
jgi:hypothetical protein